jgi:pimeloyl-ACP methyl ester carboxylesterase
MADNTSGSFELDGTRVTWFREQRGPGPVICAAHPVEEFGQGTAALLADVTGCSVVCVSPDVSKLSLEAMVEQIEGVRRALGYDRWYFWGMSGGGWLSQLYARKYPEPLLGIVIESVCACFRERLGDPECAFSPFFPAWREALQAKGLIDPASHAQPSSAENTEWTEIEGVGSVFRRRGGPALLVSPIELGERMREAMPKLWTFDSRSWLGEIRVPTLVMTGTADPVVPVAHAQRVAEAINGARFLAIQGAGHVPTAERSAAVTRAWTAFRG